MSYLVKFWLLSSNIQKCGFRKSIEFLIRADPELSKPTYIRNYERHSLRSLFRIWSLRLGTFVV